MKLCLKPLRKYNTYQAISQTVLTRYHNLINIEEVVFVYEYCSVYNDIEFHHVDKQCT